MVKAVPFDISEFWQIKSTTSDNRSKFKVDFRVIIFHRKLNQTNSWGRFSHANISSHGLIINIKVAKGHYGLKF